MTIRTKQKLIQRVLIAKSEGQRWKIPSLIRMFGCRFFLRRLFPD